MRILCLIDEKKLICVNHKSQITSSPNHFVHRLCVFVCEIIVQKKTLLFAFFTETYLFCVDRCGFLEIWFSFLFTFGWNMYYFCLSIVEDISVVLFTSNNSVLNPYESDRIPTLILPVTIFMSSAMRHFSLEVSLSRIDSFCSFFL